jgi:hypothetical protein
VAGSLRLVVARHDEDLGWLDRVDRRWHRSVITKGQQVPNTGREASSWLYAMENVCREDDGWVCFVQGDPFDHYPELLTVLNKAAGYPSQFVPLGTEMLSSDGTGGPHDSNLEVADWFEAMIAPWPGSINFAPGGQFLAPAWILRGRTLDEIRAARALVDEAPEDVGAHTMERLWWAWLVF